MRLSNFAQHSLDSLCHSTQRLELVKDRRSVGDELEDAEDRLKAERRKVPFDPDSYAVAASDVERLRRTCRDFDGT